MRVFPAIILLLFSYQALAVLSTNNVGRAAAGSGYTESGGTYTTYGSGSGLWIQTDGFSYFWRGLSGDGSVVARVVSYGGSTNVIAGVMLRETLEYDSHYWAAYVTTNVTGSDSASGSCRNGYSTPLALVTTCDSATVTLPQWVRIERQTNTFIVSHSDDGATWVTNTTSLFVNAYTNCLYAGLFVLNGRDDANATVTFDNVTITGTEPSTATFNAEIAGVMSYYYPTITPSADLAQINAQAAVFRAQRSANPSFFKSGKKFIASNLPANVYTITLFDNDLADMEQRPFDGVVLKLGGITYGWNANRARSWNENSLVADYEALTNFTSAKFTDNFYHWESMETDWFSDQQWGACLTNIHMMAKACLLGKFAGIWFDAEGAEAARNFNYRKSDWPGIGCWQYSWDDYSAKVRERGSNWIQAVESELPRAQILMTFMFPQFSETFNTNTWTSARQTGAYGLLPDFVSGMLLGSTNSTTRFIDGTEAAYAGGTQWQTLAQYTNRANYFWTALSPIEIYSNALPIFTNQAKFGLSVMPANVYGKTANSNTDAVLWQNVVYWTLLTADRYVWDWHTTPSMGYIWATNWANTTGLPYRYVEGILAAEALLSETRASATTLRVGTMRMAP